MAGQAVGTNLPSFMSLAATVTTRDGEYTGTPFSDTDGNGDYDTYKGCNRAGANAPGIGIGTGNLVTLADERFSLLDQAGATREPQDSMYIGGTGLGSGNATVTPLNVVVDPNGTPTFTTEPYLVIADAQAAPGVAFDTVSGALNRTSVTIEIGEYAWGSI